MLYKEIKMKDFTIHSVDEEYYDNFCSFNGTFADVDYTDIYQTSLGIEYKGKFYTLKVRLDTESLGSYNSVSSEEGRGITTELLTYIIRELTNEEKSNLQQFIGGFSRFCNVSSMTMFVEDSRMVQLGKIRFNNKMGEELLEMIQEKG